jgi:hypothetical protein
MCSAADPLFFQKATPMLLLLVAGSFPGFGHWPYGRGGASGLAAATFQHPISDGRLAGNRQLRAMVLHTVANASSARLDRAAERLDIIHACPVHRPTFGLCEHGNKNSDRDDKSIS